MFFNWLWLEYEASAELYLPGLSGRRHSRNITKGAGGRARNGRSSKDCVVERVEGLETKLEVDPVDDLDVLQDRSIHVVEAIGPHGAKGLQHGQVLDIPHACSCHDAQYLGEPGVHPGPVEGCSPAQTGLLQIGRAHV